MDSESRIVELEAKVEELTVLVERLASAAIQPTPPEPEQETVVSTTAPDAGLPTTSSRRVLLKIAGAAAVGAAASAATGALPAAATNGINIADPTAFVRNDYTGTGTGAAFLFQSGSTYSSGAAEFPAALAGWVGPSGTDNIPTGIYGYTSKAGYGVVGIGAQADAVGIYADGDKANLELRPLGDAGPLRATAYTQGHLINDSSGNLWLCVADGTPGTWRKIAGPATSGSLHLLAAPKRVYDSRVGEAPATGPKTPLTGATRTIDCTLNTSGVPAGATGLVLNLTAVSATASGFLSVSPGGSGFSGTSTLNWTAIGAIVANSVTVGAGAGATVDVHVGGGSANFIVDVFGYYA